MGWKRSLWPGGHMENSQDASPSLWHENQPPYHFSKLAQGSTQGPTKHVVVGHVQWWVM